MPGKCALVHRNTEIRDRVRFSMSSETGVWHHHPQSPYSRLSIMAFEVLK